MLCEHSEYKRYKIEANDALDGVASKINAIGNSQAVSNEDIVEFLTRSSSAMAEANSTLDETIALGTAITEITRDAANAGQVMKTASMRLRGYDEDTEELSEDVQQLVGNIADLTKTAEHPIGISIFTDESKTTYKSPVQVLREISQIYDELTDKQQARILEALGGKRGGQALAAALNNFEAVEKSLNTMQHSAGNAMQEMSIIEESLDYKLNKLKETGVGVAQNVFSQESIGGWIELATKALEIIDSLTKSVGGLGTAFTGLMAYKGLRGQGIFDIFGAGKSSVNGIKNFFTQPILLQKGIDLGLTQDSIQRLNQYNNLIKQNVSVTSAYHQTMRGADDATKLAARSIANGTVQLNELTTASKAAQLGMSLLNAAMNIGVSFIISAAIKQMYEWAHSFENAAEKADNAITKLQERKDENNQLQELIDKYKQLKEAETSENKQETRKQTLELQKEITNLIAKQPGLYDKQLKNIDLVNGKLDEQLDLLGQINQENSKSVIKSAEAAYRSASDATEKYKPNFWTGKNTIRLEDEGYQHSVNDTNGIMILNELLSQKFMGRTRFGAKATGLHPNTYYDIEFAKDTSWTQRLKFLDEAIEALEQSAEFDTSQKGLYDQLLAAREDINKVVGKEIQAATDYAQLLTESVVQTDMTNVKSYSDFIEARKKVIDELSNDGTIKKALLDGVLSDEDIENYVNEYISSLDNFSTYYDAWVRNTAQATQSDYEKAKSMLSLEDVEVDFDYSEYKEKINETTDSLSKLSSAYAKLVEGNATSSDILSIVDNFPELAQYANDTKTLTEKVKELGQQKAEPLLTELRNLAKTVKDPEQKAQIEGIVIQLEKMAGLSEGIKKTADAVKQISVDDYIKYEEDNIQKIIDKLEKEKDSQNDVLDSLKQQKETLEQTISEYEKVADVVGKYIDRTQIQPLEDRKSELEEYYNTQIEKLKEENDERDRNIELQEKQNALANARKSRARVQTETEGWVWKNDNKAIRDAEKDLADYQNDVSIENLEKARDKEVENIDDQIKSWEKYKDEWKKQVEAITEADNELIASKVLGADWQEQVSEQNIGVMTNYGAEYASYNNQLKNQVNVEIAATEKAIKEREKEISDWKEYKTDVSNLNKEITDSNNEYLDNFNQFVLDENSTWEDRIEHMEQNVAIIKRLNREANSVGGYGLYHGNEFIDSYSSEEEAEQARRKEAEKIAKRRTKSNVPDSVLETIIQSIMSSMTIERYATGGVNIQTGLSWLDGSNTSSEVVFNSSQAKQLYDIVRNGDYSKMLGENILSNIRTPNNQLNNDNQRMQSTSNTINISFAGANINAESYESFKDYMDRYTGDLFLQLQTGKK